MGTGYYPFRSISPLRRFSRDQRNSIGTVSNTTSVPGPSIVWVFDEIRPVAEQTLSSESIPSPFPSFVGIPMTLRPFVMVMEMACSIHPLENPMPIGDWNGNGFNLRIMETEMMPMYPSLGKAIRIAMDFHFGRNLKRGPPTRTRL